MHARLAFALLSVTSSAAMFASGCSSTAHDITMGVAGNAGSSEPTTGGSSAGSGVRNTGGSAGLANTAGSGHAGTNTAGAPAGGASGSGSTNSAGAAGDNFAGANFGGATAGFGGNTSLAGSSGAGSIAGNGNAGSAGASSVCTAQATRCDGATLQVCDGKAWTSQKSCVHGCNNGKCLTTAQTAGVVSCGGGLTCTTSAGCCNGDTPVCGGCSTQPLTVVHAKCDGNNDCGAGTVCCLGAGAGYRFASYCTTEANCVSKAGVTIWHVCDPDQPVCAAGSSCVPSGLASAKQILSVCHPAQ